MKTRPKPLTVRVEHIPEVIQRERRFVVWRYELRDGKWTKVPYQPSGALAKINDPRTLTTFAAAVTAWRVDGIGFVLGEGWAGVDLDDCLTDTGTPTLDAQTILNRLTRDGVYHEVSPSGSGIKAIGRSARIGGEIDFAKTPPKFSTYEGARFFALTGHGAGDPNVDLTPFITDWFRTPAPAVLDLSSPREGYLEGVEMDDFTLLAMMIGGTDERSEKRMALWFGTTTGYASQSEADLALCCHLVWWCNYDVKRVDRMFRQSKLYREKWDRTKYRERTLRKAFASSTAPDAPVPEPTVKITAADLDTDWTGEF